MDKLDSSYRPQLSDWCENANQPTRTEIEEYNKALGAYSLQRFPLGCRFELSREYVGRPKGTKCIVVKEWPDTQVLWDAWGSSPVSYGRRAKRVTRMSERLDKVLVHVDAE